MAKLKAYENLVLKALEESPETRKDDFLLMLKVCEYKELNTNLSFGYAIKNHNEIGLPNWKTVERCRRKIQNARPELKDFKTAKNRSKEEKEYREYSHT